MTMQRSRWFDVVSPEYCYIVPVLDYGQGPKEYARDYVKVRATSKRRAKVLALRYFRRQYAKRGALSKPFYLDDGCPFNGMLALPFPSEET